MKKFFILNNKQKILIPANTPIEIEVFRGTLSIEFSAFDKKFTLMELLNPKETKSLDDIAENLFCFIQSFLQDPKICLFFVDDELQEIINRMNIDNKKKEAKNGK